MSNTPPPHLWLTLMTAAGNEENLRELVEPLLPYIDGIVAVVHRPCEGDEGLAYLNASKGCGKIIVRDWVQRHDVSQSETLYAGVIQEGDLFIITDTLERPAAQFISRCKGDLNTFMLARGLDCLYYFGKAFIVRYNEEMHYRGSPHWGLVGVRNGIELSQTFPNEAEVRLNVRPLKRVGLNHHWCLHYARYYVSYPAGANVCALGIEQHPGDPQQAFVKREALRLEFRREMKRRGISLTIEGLKGTLIGEPIDPILLAYCRREKVLSDLYWFLRGRVTELKDTHASFDALPIP